MQLLWLCNLEIGTQFQNSENAQHNLESAQFPKLHGTYKTCPNSLLFASFYSCTWGVHCNSLHTTKRLLFIPNYYATPSNNQKDPPIRFISVALHLIKASIMLHNGSICIPTITYFRYRNVITTITAVVYNYNMDKVLSVVLYPKACSHLEMGNHTYLCESTENL